MNLETFFQEAVAASQELKQKPNDTSLLNLYALYKQATQGDLPADTVPPAMFDFVGKAKYDAWKKLSGKTIDEAKNDYIHLIEELKKQY